MAHYPAWSQAACLPRDVCLGLHMWCALLRGTRLLALSLGLLAGPVPSSSSVFLRDICRIQLLGSARHWLVWQLCCLCHSWTRHAAPSTTKANSEAILHSEQRQPLCLLAQVWCAPSAGHGTEV